MKTFFRLHEYSENKRAKIATFSITGKANIWWEDVNNVKGIREEKLTWSEFKILFRKKYLSERYYDDRENEFYELKMGSMTDEEYTSRFLELLRYVPYLKEEKENIQRLISGLSVSFKGMIEFDEPRSLEKYIKTLKHRYKQLKCKYESKQVLMVLDLPTFRGSPRYEALIRPDLTSYGVVVLSGI